MVNALLCGGYAQTVNSTKTNYSPSPSNTSSSSPCGTTTDTVSISDEAKYAVSSSPLLSLTEGGTIYLEDIEEALSRETAAVEKKLQSLYAQLGISSSAQMKISVGGDGSILVKGESPKAEALAEAINEDGELANTIRECPPRPRYWPPLKKPRNLPPLTKKTRWQPSSATAICLMMIGSIMSHSWFKTAKSTPR